MRVLLDECVPRRLGRELLGHEVKTTPDMGWAGRRNGDLLHHAQNHFDVFITVDRRLQHQQNLRAFNIAVIILAAQSNALRDLRSLVPAVLESLAVVSRGAALVLGPAER